jgi:hypothetical protein
MVGLSVCSGTGNQGETRRYVGLNEGATDGGIEIFSKYGDSDRKRRGELGVDIGTSPRLPPWFPIKTKLLVLRDLQFWLL